MLPSKPNFIKFFTLVIFICLLFFSTGINAQCAFGGANSGVTVNPTLTTQSTPNIQAGSYFIMNVVNGGTYTVSTCGLAGWDTQLTIRSSTGTFVSYNDDSCGLQSQTSFTAAFTGQVHVRLSRYSCNTTTNTSQVSYSGTAPAPPIPTINIDNVSIDEDGGNAVFTAEHTGANAAGVFTVNYQTVNGTASSGSDFTFTSGVLNFNGIVGDTKTITIPILDDFVFEGNETFNVEFTSKSDPTVDISDTGIGTIDDNESDPNAPRPYEERYAVNIQGNFLMKGNTNLRCTSGCPSSPTTNNPGVFMGYEDVDSDGSTVNSSSSNISIPVGASVIYAGLYWGGLYNSSNSGITNPSGTLSIDEVKLKTPGSATYSTITAEVRNIETTSFAGWRSFMSHADITSQVQSAGNGNYFIADIALATGRSFTGPYGGWNMVVIYEDPAEKTRNIALWDGFDFFGFGANDTFTVTGLLTPSSGTFDTHAGYFAFDGEANRTGDFVSINGTALSNALNPNNNTLNGTISEFGVDVGGRNPNFSYSWGVDIDVFDATGFVPNSATDMDVILGSSSEGVWGGAFVVSNEIAFPAVASKAFNPTVSFLGDESRVTITLENPAKGVLLTNLSLTDNLPAGMVLSSTPNATSSLFGLINATPGASSFSISGVTLPAGSNIILSFDVVTDEHGVFLNTISSSDVSNNQNIPLSGDSSGTLTVKIKTVITNRRITYRVKKE